MIHLNTQDTLYYPFYLFYYIMIQLQQCMIWGYRNVLGPKNRTRKIDKSHKDFGPYHLFTHNFWAKMFGYSHHIFSVTRRTNTFWSNSFDKFWCGGIRTIQVQTFLQETFKKSPMMFELYQVVIHIFFVLKCPDTPKTHNPDTC